MTMTEGTKQDGSSQPTEEFIGALLAALGVAGLLLPVAGALTRYVGLTLGGFPSYLAPMQPLGSLSLSGFLVALPALFVGGLVWALRWVPERQVQVDRMGDRLELFKGACRVKPDA